MSDLYESIEGGIQGSGGSAGGTVNPVFTYTATGAEGTTFTVNLPSPQTDTNYVAQVTEMGGSGTLYAFDAPQSGYTTGTIQVVTSAQMAAGTKIGITVIRRTA